MGERTQHMGKPLCKGEHTPPVPTARQRISTPSQMSIFPTHATSHRNACFDISRHAGTICFPCETKSFPWEINCFALWHTK